MSSTLRNPRAPCISDPSPKYAGITSSTSTVSNASRRLRSPAPPAAARPAPPVPADCSISTAGTSGPPRSAAPLPAGPPAARRSPGTSKERSSECQPRVREWRQERLVTQFSAWEMLARQSLQPLRLSWRQADILQTRRDRLVPNLQPWLVRPSIPLVKQVG